MKTRTWILWVIFTVLVAFNLNAFDRQTVKEVGRFNIEKDLLLVHFDCKTDVDDIQTAAALVTLLSDSAFSGIKYHAVAGTYGIQDGLYVPPNPLFRIAFGEKWTDAHGNFEGAIEKVKVIVKATLENQGDVWIAEAGQSDFTARLIKVIQADLPEVSAVQRIHVVQHSNWNEEVTSLESLEFVKQNADYNKIPDGNAVGNGTPGFRCPEFTQWQQKIQDQRLTEIWQLAIDISNQFNGKEGRYNNAAIAAGGLDFSDLAEVCWILGLEDIRDTEQFFELYGK